MNSRKPFRFSFACFFLFYYYIYTHNFVSFHNQIDLSFLIDLVFFACSCDRGKLPSVVDWCFLSMWKDCDYLHIYIHIYILINKYILDCLLRGRHGGVFVLIIVNTTSENVSSHKEKDPLAWVRCTLTLLLHKIIRNRYIQGAFRWFVKYRDTFSD